MGHSVDVGRRAILALALLMLVGLPAADAQVAGIYEQDGVAYYMATGEVAAGHVSQGLDYNATNTLPFTGCAVAKLRPDMDLGRIRTIAVLDGAEFEVEFTQFSANRTDMQGGIALDNASVPLYVDGSRTHGSIQTPKVRADVAAWGMATVSVNDRALLDPTTGAAAFDASFFVTSMGFRDDETGEIHNSDGTPYTPGSPAIRNQGEREMHLRIESRGSGAPPTAAAYSAPTGAESNTGYFSPSEAYSQAYTIQNQRYGGEAEVDVRFTSLGFDGDNELTFTAVAPNGTVLGSYTGTPGLMETVEGGFTFPLRAFGDYVLRVDGRVSMSQYDITVTQASAEPLDLNFWWDGVHAGYAALEAIGGCEDAVAGGTTVQGVVPQRPQPPGFPWVQTTMTILAVTTVSVVLIKLVMMVRSAAAHRNAVRQ